MHPKPLDPQLILTQSPLADIRHFDEVGSTNDVAKQLVESSQPLALPTLVIADVQTQGRGRSGKTWWSEPGSLAFSLVFANAQFKQPGLIAVAAALGIASAIRRHAQELKVQIKWPNDVYVEARKVAGVLIETVSNQLNGSTLVLGIGVNLNCDLNEAPAELVSSAGSVLSLLGAPTDPNEFLCSLITSVAHYLDEIRSDSTRCLREYAKASLFEADSPMLITLPNGQTLNGAYAGIGDNGQLLLNVREELIEVNSATVDQFTAR